MRYKKKHVETCFADYCKQKKYAPSTVDYYASVINRFVDKYGAFDTDAIDEHIDDLGKVFKYDHVRNVWYILRSFGQYIVAVSGDAELVKNPPVHNRDEEDLRAAVNSLSEKTNLILRYAGTIQDRLSRIEAFLSLPPIKRAFAKFDEQA